MVDTSSDIRYTKHMTRRYTKNPSKQTGFRIPLDLLKVIDDLAAEKFVTRSDVVVSCLRRQLKIPAPAPVDPLGK